MNFFTNSSSHAQSKIQTILVVDAVPGAEMFGVEFFAEKSERRFYASSIVRKSNREIMPFPNDTIPNTVRITWRKSSKGHPIDWGSGDALDDTGKRKLNYIPPDNYKPNTTHEIERRKIIMRNTGRVQNGPWGSQYGDEVIGDFTIPVFTRIPDAVIKKIMDVGGTLRLKFRLKPDGVIFGWDIESNGGNTSTFSMPGGDFTETNY